MKLLQLISKHKRITHNAQHISLLSIIILNFISRHTEGYEHLIQPTAIAFIAIFIISTVVKIIYWKENTKTENITYVLYMLLILTGFAFAAFKS